MKNTTYLIIGLIMGYFMAIGCGSSVMASSDLFDLGTQYNPMYVKVVN
jgi:hypothetical protein